MLRALRSLGAPTVIVAAALFAFFFFLRPSEYCVSNRMPGFQTKIARIGAVTRRAGAIHLRVVARKNNPGHLPMDFGCGPASDPALCPIRALDALLLEHPTPSSPDAFIFLHRDGAILTASELGEWLRRAAHCCGRDATCISAHSLRVGGATMAYRSGMGETWIMFRGFWQSLAGMQRYCRNFPEDDAWCTDMLGGAFLATPVAPASSRRTSAPAIGPRSLPDPADDFESDEDMDGTALA
jgi:hypothetical protein